MQNQTVLNKMMRELQLAQANEQDKQAFLQHINNIKLLCELFLEEEAQPVQETVTPSFTEQEIKAMLGEKNSTSIEQKKSSLINHDDANGDSIFDF